ncbi:MAG: hypothetical protein IPO92_17160 [Saprospiraceae bacterium]|nr:hypothetical protein [Saprospiraceae bacterium]
MKRIKNLEFTYATPGASRKLRNLPDCLCVRIKNLIELPTIRRKLTIRPENLAIFVPQIAEGTLRTYVFLILEILTRTMLTWLNPSQLITHLLIKILKSNSGYFNRSSGKILAKYRQRALSMSGYLME